MRLNDFDPDAIHVEDQRGGRMPMGNGGKLGCGSFVIILIAALVFGVDPAQMLGGMEEMQQQTPQEPVQGGNSIAESCSVNQFSREACAHLASLNETWKPLFSQAGIAFTPPKLVFYSQNGQSGCGAAQSAMGPFYCTGDNGIYIDTDFFSDMEQQMGAGGDFARAYVMAHEYGHHVQNITGLSGQVQSAQAQNPRKANALQVRVELQADCYAGVWAARNKDRIEPGDIEEGLNAAHQIGDDTLMKNAGQRPVEASFTHGSSAQRIEWLRKGLQTGNEESCDTFGS